MSSITIEELKKLPAESYQIIDIRDEIEISHGAVKGALACKPEEIMENPEVDKTRKLVICCSRGINSKEIAKKLEEEGLDAVSLEKGYIAWLMDAMKSSQDEDFAKTVEISLRKKFKKKIWSRFTKAINTYELVKPGDKIQITEYQSYMNYSYIIEPAVAMSGCYPNSQRIKAKEGTIVSVEKAPLSGYVVIAEFEE